MQTSSWNGFTHLYKATKPFMGALPSLMISSNPDHLLQEAHQICVLRECLPTTSLETQNERLFKNDTWDSGAPVLTIS